MSYKSKFTGQQVDQGIDKANSAYQKPQTGIPASDLSEDVQSSLGKARTAVQTETDPTVPEWAKNPTKPSYNAQEVGALPADTPLFDGDYNSLTNKPDLSGFITISVNNLVNYYLKSETYTKQEVQSLIAAIQQFHYEIYASTSDVTNPQSNVLYLIGPIGTGADKYEEYVYANSQFVKIGDTSIDLSGYYTSQQTDTAIMQALNTALAGYTTTAALTLLLAGKEDVTTIVAPVNETDATLPITTLTTEIGKYYRIDVPIKTLAVTLPAMDTVTSVKKVGIYFTAGTTPAVTITSADSKDVYYQDGYELEAGKTYKVNALFDGSAWIVDVLTIKVPFFAKLTLTNGEVVELQGSEELTSAMTSSYKSTLVSAEIGELCTSISRQAFENCRGLTSITIPNSVTSIGDNAFSSCTGLTSVTIGSGVTSIGSFAFSDCIGLTSITIPNSVTSIGEGAFVQCTGLTSITIPNSVTNIGNEAFSSCEGLTSVTIGSGVTSIGEWAFSGCTALTSITIPDNVTSIGNGVFEYCTGLTDVTIGNGVTSISNNAFMSCSSLTSVTSLAMTAPTIETDTFQDVKTGGTLTVPSGSTGYDTWMGTGNYYLGKYNWTKVEK